MRPWRFEQMWLEDSGCRDTVVQTWDRLVLGSPMELVVAKLGACQQILLNWSRNSFCHVRREISEKKKLLKVAESEAAQGRQVDRFLKLKSDIVDLLRLDEKMWQQRSKEHWMISGDCNSKFFHTRASQRFRRNKIVELRNSEGARWRVGDGKLIRIFSDKWLPCGDGVLSPSSGELHPEATVSELINRTSGWWNIQLIDRCFHPPDAAQIKSLPLCSTPQSDVLIWPLEKSGKYSVKTGYSLLCVVQDPAESSLQVSMDEWGFWKKLWKISAPGKIKHFLWRACTNSLATKENLVKRKILTDATCSRCLVASEGSLHSLWSCSSLKEVWEKDFGWIPSSGAAFTSFEELVELVFTKPESVALFATTVWSVWFHRNKTRLNENTRPLGQLVGFARDYIRDYRTQKHCSTSVRKVASKRWCPPEREFSVVKNVVKICVWHYSLLELSSDAGWVSKL
nr:putative ribonuclease h protein [Quercus suber]